LIVEIKSVLKCGCVGGSTRGSIESWVIIVMYPIRFRYSANIYNPYIYIQYARKLPFTSM